VFVNGVEWDTGGATITIDDAAGIESELRVGQVVLITGELDDSGTTGTADTVEYDSALEGPIADIDLAAGTFVVLGQTVQVTAGTAFDDSIPDDSGDGQRSLADLAVNDVVEVSGLRDAGNAIRATRVELRGGAGDFELRGVISNLNIANETFSIGNLAVDYTGATLSDFGGAAPANGQTVEVEGALVGPTFQADKVELEDPLPGEDGDGGEVEGYISNFTTATAQFRVNGVAVIANAGTEYRGGVVGDLANNVKIELEGEFNPAGVLVADEIEFRVQDEDEDVEIAALVATVSTATGVVTLQGVGGITVRVVPATRLEDNSDADVEDFSLADLVPGDYVEIRGAVDPSPTANDIIATRLEREDNDDDEFLLQGPVQEVNEPDLTILGVTVQTDVAIFLLDDEEITEAEFFALVATGVVKAKSDLADVGSNIVLADEVEIEELD
jgi:hypothetical protein